MLIVDGAASSLRYLDEAFFTQTALQATEGAVQLRSVDPDALTPADLAGPGNGLAGDTDAVLLLNVHALSKEVATALKHFVERGGGLFVSLGDRTDPDALNESLGALLPSPLRLVKTAAIPPREAAATETNKTSITGQGPAHFAQIDYASPIFAPFNAAAREGLLEAQFYRYVLVEPPPPDAHVLATYDDGSPAILTARRGRGHVVLFTSSVAREWTDWPIRVSFVPLMQQIVLGLSGVEEAKTSPSRTHRNDARLPGIRNAGDRRCLPEWQGARRHPGRLGRGQRRPIGRAGDCTRTKVKGAGGAIETPASQDFAVAFDPRESDTRRLDPSELAARYNAKVSTEGGPVDEEHRRIPLWTDLLAAAALLLLAESLLLG